MKWTLRRKPELRERRAVDAEVVAWIRDARRPFGDYVVGSLVPPVFDRYARILHPAWASGIPVRWAEVASWSGRTIHPLVQWDRVSRPLAGSTPPPFDRSPDNGNLPQSDFEALCRLLAKATSTPGRCIVGAWEGYGWTGRPECLLWPELRLDQRAYLVTAGWIDPTRGLVWPRPRELEVFPSLLWPSDRAWFLATDPDLDSTYVGGSAELTDAVLAEPALEGVPAGPDDGVTAASDSVNAG